jgi:hypothetical protein
MSPTSNHLDEDRSTLWVLTFSPAIWAVHFLVSYSAGAIWCGVVAGREGSLGPVRLAILGSAVLAIVAIALIGRRAWRSYRHWNNPAEQHADTAEARHRFLGFATVLLSILSAIAVIYVAAATLFVRGCY